MKSKRIAKFGVVLIALLIVVPWAAKNFINNDGVAEKAKVFAINYAVENKADNHIDATVIRRTVMHAQGEHPETRKYVIRVGNRGKQSTVTVTAQKTDEGRYDFYIEGR